MKAIILAAGEGKRMRPLTLEAPKPMLTVLGKPILHHLLDVLPQEITEVIFVVGYKHEQIESYFGSSFGGRGIRYVIQEKPEGTGHALMLCKDLIKPTERFLFMAGDDLHSPTALKRLLAHDHAVLVHTHTEPHRFGVIEVDAKNKVVSFEETPEVPKSNLVSLAVFVLTGKIFSYPMKPSRTGEYWSTDQIRAMMDDVVFVAEPSDFWLPIGRPSDLAHAEKRLGFVAEPQKTPVLILAGGKGTRLPVSEQGKPKCLVEIAGKPLLAWQFEHLRQQGFYDITLSLGYKAEMVIEWLRTSGNTEVKYVVEKEPRGTGGGLKLALGDRRTPFLALNVDDLADVDYRLMIRHALGSKYHVIAGARMSDASAFGTLECSSDKKICEFKEKQQGGRAAMVSIGHYYLQGDVFSGTPDAFSIERDLFPTCAQEGSLVLYEHTGGYWLPTNTDEQLRAARDSFA